MAQALIAFLQNQFVERDGEQHRFFGGCFGIFGHGNLYGAGTVVRRDTGRDALCSVNRQRKIRSIA